MARLPAFHTRFLRSESLFFQQVLVLVRQPSYLKGPSVRPMTENPYLSPSDVPPATTPATDDKANPALLTIARQTFLAWEKLRVVYVAILAVITILLIAPSGFLSRRLLLLTAEGAVVANTAYFAGPIVETYIKWLGYDRAWPRWVMFAAGTLLSIILAVGTLASGLLPDQD